MSNDRINVDGESLSSNDIRALRARLATAERERDEAIDRARAMVGAELLGLENQAREAIQRWQTANAERDALRGECERLKSHAPGSTSDGYHTFDELYDHRITLFIALCHEVAPHTPVWRSKLHSDGTAFDGWFVLGMGTKPGEQITYHLPMSRWADTDWLNYEEPKAPEFDGHTGADVLKRLARLTDMGRG